MEIVVRYDANPVMALLAWLLLDKVELSKPSVAPVNEANGSTTSLDGLAMGVGRVDGMVVELAEEWWRLEEVLLTLLDEGEASRVRVFKKVDLRLVGGVGTVDASIGRLGSLEFG